MQLLQNLHFKGSRNAGRYVALQRRIRFFSPTSTQKMQILPLSEEYLLQCVYEPGGEESTCTHETSRDAMTENIA
jgi:hypothetical protein